jgi:hypothetical protein
MKYDLEMLKSDITIGTLLDEFSVPHKRNRAACPIHAGDNKSAFSFNDELWNCHSCGAGGDIITLIQELQRTDFHGAVQYLAKRKGITLDAPEGTTEFTRDLTDLFERERRTLPSKQFVELVVKTDELNRVVLAQATVKDRINRLTVELAALNQMKKRKKIALNLYYLNTQRIDDNRLAKLDEKEAELNYKIKAIKQEISRLRKLGRK